MEVRIRNLLRGARKAEGTVVIIDVYRAFTTEAIAFLQGADRIVLVGKIGEALELRRKGVGSYCIGEVEGRRPEGFDFGNSPFELKQVDLVEKTLIHCTMAGTVGVDAAKMAKHIYAGALVTAEATVKAILGIGPDLVTLVPMGWAGRIPTDEDEQCALYMRNLLQGRKPDKNSVRALVLIGGESQKFGDPEQPHFHLYDRDLSLKIDEIPFAIRVTHEDGFLVARPEFA